MKAASGKAAFICLRSLSMKDRSRNSLIVPLAALACLAAAGAIALYAVYLDRTRNGEPLTMGAPQMPTGILAAEADQLMGGPPDRTARVSGILINSTLLDATNAKAAKYGPPQDYNLRIWERGSINVTVVIGSDGRVVGRYARKKPAT
jgi:hypothetical protein